MNYDKINSVNHGLIQIPLTTRHCERSMRSNPLAESGDCFVRKSTLLAMTVESVIY
jgi:hypothetical protein